MRAGDAIAGGKRGFERQCKVAVRLRAQGPLTGARGSVTHRIGSQLKNAGHFTLLVAPPMEHIDELTIDPSFWNMRPRLFPTSTGPS
jgi:hypothetical protein